MKSISLYKEYVFDKFSMKNSKYVEFPKFLYYDLQGSHRQYELKYKNVVNEYGSKHISHPLFVYNGFEGSSKPVYISYPEY